ncbi:hypothetical protein MIND_00681700 [Mycena indigotica]|uniref:Uncharacterized protein n=1 Tax=Mycena indigotica TaxID=2126181 RepID=A0A8H6W154_9AGAR|nr:uncharacterized protein MIND_00681700 [Mycena indigotica]KAF7301172.1 hypothetical protein MIND_00681700 [Mycena indigotica]
MGLTIQVKFDETSTSFTAQRLRIAGDSERVRFSALPEVAQILRVPAKAFYANGPGDGERKRAFLSNAPIWGLEDMATIYYAKGIAVDGTRFCLRFIFNASQAIRDPESNNYQIYSRLLQDAKFSSQDLSSSAGVLTPIHFGLWLMKTEDWAGNVIFSLTQWCGISWKSLMRTKYNTLQNRALVGRTFEAFHDMGFKLVKSDSFDSWHLQQILLDIEDPHLTENARLNGNARCFIAGFSDAVEHCCKRKVPVLPIGCLLPRNTFGCEELRSLSLHLGFTKTPTDPPDFALKAVEWYECYRQQHTNYASSSLLMAQRKRMFPRPVACLRRLGNLARRRRGFWFDLG